MNIGVVSINPIFLPGLGEIKGLSVMGSLPNQAVLGIWSQHWDQQQIEKNPTAKTIEDHKREANRTSIKWAGFCPDLVGLPDAMLIYLAISGNEPIFDFLNQNRRLISSTIFIVSEISYLDNFQKLESEKMIGSILASCQDPIAAGKLIGEIVVEVINGTPLSVSFLHHEDKALRSVCFEPTLF